ncbi:MAG TPA: DUF2378 family protein, partial [Myxococcaceae bacterium]|nr:DUF2378 family protein [Myxococcaceae bacterium]
GRVPAALFEGLFIRALKADEAFIIELRKAGFDSAQIQKDYSAPVWIHCVRLAERRYYPALTAAEAQWQLGRRLVQGMLQTALGRLLAAAIPMLGPKLYLRRFPLHVKGTYPLLEVTPVQLSDTTFRMECRNDPQTLPPFVAGVLEESMVLARVKAQVELAILAPGEFDITLRW